MAESYIELPIETDSDELAGRVLDDLMVQQPGWVPQEGHLEVWLVEALARIEAETRDVATRVPPSIFRYFGKSLMGIAATEAAAAQMQSTWTTTDNAGYTIEVGTTVGHRISGDEMIYFQTKAEVVIPAGQTSTAVGEVELVAVDQGERGNAIPSGTQLTLVDALAFVRGITTTTTSSGGVNGESDEDYMDRLAQELTLLSPRPILANDFAVLAQRIAGVDRAVAIDGYNPNNRTFGNERMVAVAVADEAGNAVPGSVRTEVSTYLDSLRETNFVVNVIDPSYTTVNVTATLKRLPGADPGTVTEAATAALRSYLSPAEWSWSPVVRHYELVALLDRIAGVDYVDALTVPSSNIILPGVAALVTAGTIQVSVI